MARRSYRPLFRQRKSLGQRLATGLSILLLAAVGVLVVAYFTLPWTTSFALRIFLNRNGWGPAAVHVTRLNARGFEIRDVSLGGRAVTLGDLTVTYSPRDLIHKRFGDITVNGLDVTARWTENGFAVGAGHLPQPQSKRMGPETQPFSFGHLVITKANLILDLPKNPVTISVTADLTPTNGHWEGQLTADGGASQGDTTSRLFQIGWQGAFSPADPENWPGKGTLDLTAAAFPVSDSDATINASGHLDFVTGNGGLSLTAPGRITVDMTALHTGSIPGVPAAWVARLANGAAFYAAGSNGGPAFILRNQDGASNLQADLDLGMNTGDTSVRAVARGKTSGAQGGVPETITIDQARLDANRIPLSVGELSGHVGLSGVTGPVILLQGNAHADFTIANPIFGSFSASSLAVTGDGQFHLNGPTIDLTPQSLSITAVDATTPALSLPGPTTLALADSGGEAQSMGVVMSDAGSPTLTFGLSIAAHGIRLTRPVRDGAKPDAFTMDLPHTRFDGYVVPATGLYDVGIRVTDAMLSHPMGDLQVPQFSARFLPSGGTGGGKAQLVRFLGAPQRTSRNTGGPNLKYDFSLSNYDVDITSSIYTNKSQPLGNITGRINLADGSGHVTLDTSNLTLGADAIVAQDVFTASSGVSDLVGTAAISFKADWNPTASSSSGQITLNDLGFHTPKLAVSELNMNLGLTSLSPLKADGPQHISAASVTAGLPFRDLALDIQLPGDNTVVVTHGSAAVAEGQASIADAVVSLAENSPAALSITLTQLPLEPVGTQMGIDGLSATGTVSGVLPVRITDGGLWVDDGHIKSDGPGHVNYQPAVRPPVLAKNSDSVFSALANFDYDSIVASINGDLLSTPRVWMAMKGRNTDLPDSEPMSFELTFGATAGHATAHDKIRRASTGAGGVVQPAEQKTDVLGSPQ